MRPLSDVNPVPGVNLMSKQPPRGFDVPESSGWVPCDVKGREGGFADGQERRCDAERRLTHSPSSFAARDNLDSVSRRVRARIESEKSRSDAVVSIQLEILIFNDDDQKIE